MRGGEGWGEEEVRGGEVRRGEERRKGREGGKGREREGKGGRGRGVYLGLGKAGANPLSMLSGGADAACEGKGI